MADPEYPCPECGSKHTILLDLHGTSGGFAGALWRMLSVFPPRRRFPQGRKILVCRDCGKKSVICIM